MVNQHSTTWGRTALGALAALAGAGAIAGLVYLPIWLHRHDPPPPSVTKRPESVVLADVPDATLAGRHNGQKIWEIHAKRIQAAADGNTTTFLGVDRGTLYQNGRPAARVAAGKAVYNENRRTLTASGVKLSANGLSLRAPSLKWSATSGQLKSPDVTVSWDGGAAAAGDLVADTRLKVLSGRNVRMAARLEGEMFEKVAKRIGMAGVAGGASLGLLLAGPVTAAPAPTPAPVKYREVRVRGDAWRYDQATKTHVYTGHIVATHGDTTLTADRIAYNEAENTATATGHIRVTNPRNRVEGDTAAVDFNRKIVRLRGESGVRIVALPTPAKEGANSLRNRIKEPVTLDCKAIDYNYRAKTASAEGPVKVSRTNQVLTGDAATYSADDDLISLTGNVHGKDEKNQTFQAPSLKVSLKEGAEWMEAPNVTATFFVKEEPEEQP